MQSPEKTVIRYSLFVTRNSLLVIGAWGTVGVQRHLLFPNPILDSPITVPYHFIMSTSSAMTVLRWR